MAEFETGDSVVSIDGKVATSVGYSRKVVDGRAIYDLSFRNGRESVQKLKGVSAEELLHAVGESNSNKIHANPADKASLKGKELDAHAGLSKEAQEKHVQALIDERLAALDVASLPTSDVLSPDRRAFAARLSLMAADHSAEAGDGNRATSRRMLPTLDADEVAARKSAVMKALEKQYIQREGKFFFKDKDKRLAFEDKGSRLVSVEKDPATAASMAKMAQAKGWDSIRVSGTQDFRRQVWLEASALGMKVDGFSPKDADKAALDHLRQSGVKNTIEKGAEQQKQGKTTEPSKDDVRSMARKAQRAEDYNLLRPEGVSAEATSKLNIVSRVASEITQQKIQNPETAARVMKEVENRLARMSSQGTVPTLQTWDRNAPSKAREIDLARPPVERNVERTR